MNYQEADMKKKEKRVSKHPVLWMVVRRTLIALLAFLLFAVGSVYALGYTLANGPDSVRNRVVLMATQASATKWLPGLFIPQSTVDQIIADSQKVEIRDDGFPTPPKPDNSGDPDEVYDEWADYPDGVRLEYIQGNGFRAYLTIVKDPSRVFVGVCDNIGSAARGLDIFSIAKKYNALAVINGGEFPDNGSSPGNVPMGITYSQGECVWEDWVTDHTFIGIDKDNKLVVSEGMTKEQAEALNVRDGVCFQINNVLITNDGKSVFKHYSDGNVGAAQRTAIGQRADGAIIMVVTDGRSAASVGASRNDVINLLYEQGAIVGGMLDGGTSALMYYEDYFNVYREKYDIKFDQLDKYQQMGIVNKFKAFIPPRTMPTYFCVAKSGD